MAPRKLITALAIAAVAAGLVSSCRTPGLPEQAHFPLTGAHNKTTCSGCHVDGVEAELPTNCAGCHLDDRPTPHADGECDSCHNTTSWEGATFSHDTLAADVTCQSCHETDRPIPHYTGDCRACHNTTSWADGAFNHDNIPVTTTCASCHETDRPRGHFDGDCRECHNTSDWEDGEFDHDFPIPHRGVSECAECHPAPAGTSEFTCLNCHEHRQSKMDAEHGGRRGYSYDSDACVRCHPSGRE